MNPHKMLGQARLMITFARIVDAGGISAAATAFQIDKAAVSRQLKELEQLMGVRLLHRSSRRIALTEVGRAVYERAARVVREVEQALGEAEHFLAAPSGVLCITSSVAFGQRRLVPLLPAFLQAYPDIELELCLLDRHVDLVEEGFDLALRLCEQPPQDLVAHALGDISYALVAAPGYLARHAPIASAAELARHDCLFYGYKTRSALWRLGHAGHTHEVTVRTRLSMNNSEALRQAALDGLGIALLPWFAIADDVAGQRLSLVLPGHAVLGQPSPRLYGLHLPGRSPPKLQVLLQFLREHLSTGAAAQR